MQYGCGIYFLCPDRSTCMVMYQGASKIVKPKIEALGVAEGQLAAAMKKLADAKQRLDGCKKTLLKLQETFETQMAEKAKPVVVAMVKCFMVIVPLYKKAFDYGYKAYIAAPYNVIQMVFGAALCFFGGTYVASIAAIEAFRQMGFARVMADLSVVQRDLNRCV